MKKQLAFQCWNCPKTYFQTIKITDQQKIVVTCQYCHADAVVDLQPYRNKTRTVMKGFEESKQDNEELQLPAILLTRKLD